MKREMLLHLVAALLFTVTAVGLSSGQPKADTTTVVLSTSYGDIAILLFEKEAPITARNFLAYVDSGFYDGTIFHRVMRGFVIQGGGFTADLARKATFPPIKNESDNGLTNDRGTLSMARTTDPHSATSQFFINLVDNARLDFSDGRWGYAVFGKVIEGMEIVDQIAAAPTETRGQFRDVPRENIVIISARRRL
ncbi:MAG: peptidyl-prolyl cis-trans isomerase [Ignavibacteria bacterium]|nr:peptidyl-prolyl cis-trans isomerase [Ignavibacteria bacterium]